MQINIKKNYIQRAGKAITSPKAKILQKWKSKLLNQGPASRDREVELKLSAISKPLKPALPADSIHITCCYPFGDKSTGKGKSLT